MSALHNFDHYCDLFAPVGALNSPAELSGMLTGRLCGGNRLGNDKWLRLALEFLDLIDLEHVTINPELGRAITDMYPATLASLEDQNLSFQLLLPDDDTDLGLRLEALGQWCHGFLTGFGSSGLNGNQEFSPDAADALRDFASIVQIDNDNDETNQQESDFFEVADYVRISAINLFLEFGVDKDQRDGNAAVIKSDPIVH